MVITLKKLDARSSKEMDEAKYIKKIGELTELTPTVGGD